MSEKRVVCLNCMDGRCQIPAIDWIKTKYNVNFVDMITEAGMDGFITNEKNSIEGIVRKISISIEKNNAQTIVIVGHHDCKGNPVDDSTHKEHIVQAVNRLKTEFTDIDVVGLWINEEFVGEGL